MGWLELIALMKRVLPLLSRVAPMLETYIATRGATRGEAEALDRISAEVKAHFAAVAQGHAELKGVLDVQDNRLSQLSDELHRLRAADAEKLVRLEQIERQAVSTARLLRTVSLLTVALLLVCIGLLVALLLRAR